MNNVKIGFNVYLSFVMCSMLCPVPVLNTEVTDKNACSIKSVNDDELERISSYLMFSSLRMVNTDLNKRMGAGQLGKVRHCCQMAENSTK